MGSKEIDKDTSTKESNDSENETPAPTSQEQSSGTVVGMVPPDWTGFQAYSPMPPHGYVASSPQPHPYMWGVQHLMPPYGTPPHPYVGMYPHSVYAHPSMPPGSYPYIPYPMPSPNSAPETSGNTPGSIEVNGKSPEGKEKLPIKRSKGSLGSLNMVTGKSSKAGASANGSYPKSGESGSEGSNEGSDANSENNLQMKSGSIQDSMEGEATQNGNSVHGSQNGRPNTHDSVVNHSIAMVPMPATPGLTTNLNIGMVAAGSRENMQQPQLWLQPQDERELKRQRRKQSNRESARRSRLRKQAECDDLAQRADILKEENGSLKAKLSRIRSKYEQLLAENASLKEKLGETPGQEKARNGQTEHVESG